MKTTILKLLGLQDAIKGLMNDGNLSIKCKLDLVTLAEEVDNALVPFNKVRAELVAKHTKTDKDGKKTIDQENFKKDILEASSGEVEISTESFKLVTSKDDKNITPKVLAIFKQFFGDKFTLETN